MSSESESPVPQNDKTNITLQQNDVSGPVLILLGVTLLGVLTTANASLLNAALGEFHPLWLAVALLAEIALIAGVLVLRPELRPAVRWNRLETLGMVVVGAAFLAHALYLAPADLMPVSFSVDNSHQHLLVDYVYQNNRFPEGVDYLYMYDDYPVAPSALAAFSARLLGVLPVQTMYPLAALLVAAQVMLVFGISIELLPRRRASHVMATCASLIVFSAHQYSVHVFSERFYSNMIMGDLIVLLALWVVTVREKLHPALTVAVAIGLVYGCLGSYPAWLPFVILPILASVMLDSRMPVRKRLAAAGVTAGITVILAVVAIIEQWNFVTWFAPVRDRRLLPGWESLSGILLLASGWGVWVLIQSWRQLFGFALFLAIDLALVVALYGVALLDKLALYIPDKTFYFNIFVLAMLAALSFNWLWDRLPKVRLQKDWVAGLIMVGLCLAAVALVNWRIQSPSVYPITLDEYRVAYQARQEMPDVELTYLVRTETTLYWIHGCILSHTHDVVEQREQWRARKPTYEGWIREPSQTHHAMVSDLTSLPQDGQWREVIRVGNSGLIEKTQWND